MLKSGIPAARIVVKLLVLPGAKQPVTVTSLQMKGCSPEEGKGP